jgi:hypothetical protein
LSALRQRLLKASIDDAVEAAGTVARNFPYDKIAETTT